jgi:hypothetical protein
MPENPTPVETVQGTTAGGVGGQDLAQAIADAVQTGISQGMQQIQKMIDASISSLQSDIDDLKKSVTTGSESDVDSETVDRQLVSSVTDPEDSHRYSNSYRDLALGNAISFSKVMDALIARKVSQDTDHHAALPPMAPRSSTGPGTTAS